MTTVNVAPSLPTPRMPAERVELTAGFLYELGQLLERHGHVTTHGTTSGAIGYALTELTAFLRTYRNAPRSMED